MSASLKRLGMTPVVQTFGRTIQLFLVDGINRLRFMARPEYLDEYGRSQLRNELIQHPVELVAVDPIPAFVSPETNTYRATEVRGFMQPLALLARELDIAILIVRHLRKGGSDTAIEAGQGSMDFSSCEILQFGVSLTASRTDIATIALNLPMQLPQPVWICKFGSNMPASPKFRLIELRYCHMASYVMNDAIKENDMVAFQTIDTAVRDFRPAPITDEEASAMFRAVVNLFGKWNVTDEQASILLDMPIRSYRRWKADGEPGRVDRDTKARLSNLMGIHKALRYMFRETQRIYSWVQSPNEAFQGRSALDIMLGGELTDLMRVRRYLDAERGGW